jgi:hypothetical protein
VLIGYLVALLGGVALLPPKDGQVLVFLGYTLVITLALLVICLKKGEPTHWRWGDE